jgi:hypothetical protein
MLARLAPALWLVAAAGLVGTLDLRLDGVVDAEAAQVRRSGGRPVPPTGTMARSTHPNGWRIAPGNSIRIPLRLREGQTIRITGWVTPAAGEATLLVGWQGSEAVPVAVTGAFDEIRLPLRAPAGGRHWLTIGCRASPGRTVVVDRVIAER